MRKNFFFNLRQSHIGKQEKLELTKKLTIVLCVLDFLNVFIDQIQMKTRNNFQKKQLKDLIFKLEKMIDKMA